MDHPPSPPQAGRVPLAPRTPLHAPPARGATLTALALVILLQVVPAPDAGARTRASAAPARAAAAEPAVQAWLTSTSGDRLDRRLAPQTLPLRTSHAPEGAIRIQPETRLQTIDGFGGALTDSAAWLIARSPARDAIVSALFGAGKGGGSVVRLPMGASDLARSAYSYDDTCCDLSDFSVAHDDAYIVPVLRQALGVNPALKVVATPWSAPGWMKFGGTLRGDCRENRNYLRNDRYGLYAQYFVRFARAYRARGVPIHAFSLQNEPGNCNSTYPTMNMSAHDQAELSAVVRRALDAAGLGAVKLIGYDHNWYDGGVPSPYPGWLMEEPAQAVDGVAFHCYESPDGASSVQSTFHQRFPSTEIHFTECSGGAWATDEAANFVWNLRTTLLGPLRHWARSSLYWSLALDPTGGPHSGGCENCRGVVTVDNAAGTWRLNGEYYAWAQVARFVKAGARRVATSALVGSPVTAVGFRNPDASLALVALNPDATARSFSVAAPAGHVSYTLPGRSAVTLRWPG